MTISLNWLKEYLEIKLSPEEISNLLTSLGLEVESMKEVESIRGGLEGVVVGEVKECWKHPNADKLSLTKVDIARGELLQIVCGAPNVAVGQKVLVATIGTTLYPLNGDSFTLKKGKIRGEESQGMICAQDELGIGEDHSGIMVLPAETPIGLSGRQYFNIEKDVIYEIGLTPNRSDATCHLGVAHDLAAALRIRYKYNSQVKMPSVENFKVDNHSLPVEIIVENTEACPRYSGVSLKGITVRESPAWLKKRLSAIGVRSINNIVDVTNFILHELGQPLHAFDLDRIQGHKVIVKALPEGTKFQSLDEKERLLTSQDLMICDGDSNGMCIGGVFGGFNSGVKDETTNIFLESAHFNAHWVRRSSTHHGLRTDAVQIFEKGSDPNICVYALKRAAMLIAELGGGEVASEVVDIYPQPIAKKKVRVAYAYVNRLIGTDIPHEQIRNILLALGMDVVENADDSFSVDVPTNKADVTRPADIVEEILRIYGLDNVPVPLQMRSSMTRSEYPEPGQVRSAIGSLLAANGFNEIMTLSLSQSAFYKDILPRETEKMVFVNKTSNTQLDIMRPDMLFSGLEAVAYNQNRQQTDLKLFEFGKTYRRIGNEEGAGVKNYEEPQHLSLFLTGQRWPANWKISQKNAPKADFFTLKSFVANVLARVGITTYQETSGSDGKRPGCQYQEVFVHPITCHRGLQELVTYGKISPGICKKMGIRNDVYYADFNWDNLLEAAKKQSISFVELNKFPAVHRDLAIVIGKSVKFSDIAALARKVGKQLLKEVNLFDVFEDEIKLGEGKKSYAVSFHFEDRSKTLQDKDVDTVMNELISAFETKLGASIRR